MVKREALFGQRVLKVTGNGRTKSPHKIMLQTKLKKRCEASHHRKVCDTLGCSEKIRTKRAESIFLTEASNFGLSLKRETSEASNYSVLFSKGAWSVWTPSERSESLQ